MPQFIITLPDSNDYGTTWAREQRNASLPQTVPQLDAQGAPVLDAQGAPVMVANPDLLTSNAAYLAWLMGMANASHCDQARAAGIVPPDAVPPPVVNSVPQQVTKRQGRQALINRGLIDLVQPAIDAIADPVVRATMQNEWDSSQSFERQRPSLIAMAAAIGITTSADLDALFIYADSLT